MRPFVSYSRGDNPPRRLIEIDRQLRELGASPYIDDIHHPPDGDRHHAVLAALDQADVFVAVKTPAYLQTRWTRFEFKKAKQARLPLVILSADAGLRPGTYEALLAAVTRP